MKHLLTSLLLLIGLTGLAQPTYLDLTIQLDNYPQETSWEIIKTQDSTLVISSPSYLGVAPSTLIDQRIFLEAGIDYTFTITDDFGDGICCGEFGDGFFLSANNCEGVIFEDYNFTTPSVSYDFNLIPCVPLVLTADVTFRVNLANAPPGIEAPGVLGSWNGWQIIPMTLGGNGVWFADVEVPLGNHLWKFADFNNPNVQELPVGIDGASCFQFDQFGFVNRTLDVMGEDSIILPPYCWESCLPCGAVAGCSNPNAINWNPWANFDDGSCIVQNTECGPGETLIEIIVTPDNFGSETSWKLFNNSGEVAFVDPGPEGEYASSPPGIPISTFLCVPIGVEYDLVIFDTYGDGLCGTCFGGSVTGNVQILDCEGQELYNLQDEFPDGNFGYDVVSNQFIPAECSEIILVEGCTDFDYVEYNPEAVIDNGSCLTEKVYGCLDPTQFNYNIDANTEDEIEECEFNLTIKDGVGDGWFGSWLGIYQFGTIFGSPQYQMGPEDGVEESFTLTLSTTQPAYVYFFVTPQSINTAQQCGFTLTNSNGDIIIDVPFFNIIPFINESGWYAYEIDPYCGNTCEPLIFGCQFPIALNYNDEANIDDGSCYYEPGCTSAGYLEYYTQGFEADFDDGSCLTEAEFGCTDPLAPNYDEDANVDTGCIPVLEGCTNELAFNFDPNANTDDGSCTPVKEGCIDPTAFNFDPLANTDDGSCIEVIFGCTIDSSFNYDPLANTDDDSCEPKILGCTDIDALNFNPEANIEDGSCIAVIFGCTDSLALNYNELANTDNNSCIAIVEGCTNPIALNYNLEANIDDLSCVLPIYGCMDVLALNYNELANVDNETCIDVIEGCMDPLALNFDPLANVNNFECDLPIYGCTDTTAFNYNELATTDNGTCLPVIEGCMNPEALNFNTDANVDDLSCVLPEFGCTDPLALNYNELANVDNGTCITIIEGCTNPEALNYNELANVEDFSCIEAIFGCTDSTAFNYNELATVDNGSCIEVIEGCTDPLAFNYNLEANTENFSCIDTVYGCTDPLAFNYDPEANTDNESCIDTLEGCTDQNADNYNEFVNTDDGSCLYDAGCVGEAGDPYWLNDGCYAWVIDVSPSCCNNEWANGCQELYNFCDLNDEISNIDEFGETQIIVFPNPARDRINIASNLRINAVLYNSIGQPVLQETNVNQLDLSRFEAGIYNLILTHNDLQFTKKIIKQ